MATATAASNTRAPREVVEFPPNVPARRPRSRLPGNWLLQPTRGPAARRSPIRLGICGDATRRGASGCRHNEFACGLFTRNVENLRGLGRADLAVGFAGDGEGLANIDPGGFDFHGRRYRVPVDPTDRASNRNSGLTLAAFAPTSCRCPVATISPRPFTLHASPLLIASSAAAPSVASLLGHTNRETCTSGIEPACRSRA